MQKKLGLRLGLRLKLWLRLMFFAFIVLFGLQICIKSCKYVSLQQKYNQFTTGILSVLQQFITLTTNFFANHGRKSFLSPFGEDQADEWAA